MVASAWYTLCVAVIVAVPTVHQSFPDTLLDTSIGSLLDSLDFLITSSADTGTYLRSSGLTLFNPGRWHGPNSWSTGGSTDAGFFEGYYYKITSRTGRTFAVIPGAVYHAQDSGGYAFVMVLDASVELGRNHQSVRLFRYNLAELQTTHSMDESVAAWSIAVGPNTFGPDMITLDLRENALVNGNGESSPRHGNNKSVIQGKISFSKSTPWPSSILLPDVMGWFAWLPGMECRHGVLSLSSTVHGNLSIASTKNNDGSSLHDVDFDDGEAYIEKDWGSTFPTTWYEVLDHGSETDTYSFFMLRIVRKCSLAFI